MLGLAQEEWVKQYLDKLVSWVKEAQEINRADIKTLTENFLILQKKVNQPIEVKDESKEIEKLKKELTDIKALMSEMLILLAKFAEEKKVIEAPKPESNQEKVKKISEELKDYLEEDKKPQNIKNLIKLVNPDDRDAAKCLTCDGFKKMVDANEEVTSTGTFMKGACPDCGRLLYKKLKK